MNRRNPRRVYIALGLSLLLPILAATGIAAILGISDHLDAAAMNAAAAQYPKYSVQRRNAMIHEAQTQLHPNWRVLSAAATLRRAVHYLASHIASSTAQSGQPTPANFVGNLTAVSVADPDMLALSRQTNCSLTGRDLVYKLGAGPVFSYTLNPSTPSYELLLHDAAGLTTAADGFKAGCSAAIDMLPARKLVYVGLTKGNVKVVADVAYNALTSANGLYTVTATTGDVFSKFTPLTTSDSSEGLLAGDFNGDGNNDLVSVNDSTTAGVLPSVTVFAGNADGSFAAPTKITLSGTSIMSAVVDDFNGDGHLDIVVTTYDATNSYLIFIAGKGDGTFLTPAAVTLAPPTSTSTQMQPMYTALISADLRGISHKDLVTGEGVVLLGNGDGTFTQSPTAAFPNTVATSSVGASVSAGDFNNDGKLDLAVDIGSAITIYLGKGDGSFTTGAAYASINNAGYVNAIDIDGDGNIDLWSGFAGGGNLGGDQYDYNVGYALMGNGDGTFRGAAVFPALYTGNNVADLNGDKALDLVGLSGQTFTSYLNDGKGGFAAASSLVSSPITVGGTSYMLGAVDSFALGDVNGDGLADLVYIEPALNGIPNGSDGTGVFIALGDGKGGFGAPTFYGVPALPASLTGAYTDYPTLTNVQLADVNQDGKADLVYNYSVTYENAAQTSAVLDTGTAVQLSNGDGTFQAPQQIVFYSGPPQNSTGVAVYSTATVTLITDLNKDGKPDLVLLAQSATIDGTLSTPVATIQVALGKGDGTFSTPVPVTGPAIMVDKGPGSVVAADMNGDGSPDLVALGSSTTYSVQVAVALGNGDGTFKAPILTNYSQQYLNPSQGLAVADFNKDGKLDVVLTDPYDSTGSGISLGNGDGSLQTTTNSSAVLPAQPIYLQIGGVTMAADFNGDGLPDVLSGNTLLLSQAAPSTGTTATTTTLKLSTLSLAAGQPLTLTATVATMSGTTLPTGTVTFLDGSTTLGSAALGTGGTATLTTSALTVGAHSLTASYAGSANFAASASAAVTATITAATADFTLALSPTSGSVASGQSAATTVTLTSINGFDQTVSLACSGVPTGAACNFSPGSVAVDSAAASTLTLTTTAATARNGLGLPFDPVLPGGSLLAVVGVALTIRPRGATRAMFRRARLAVCVIGGALLLQSCGGNDGSGSTPAAGGTAPGTYSITVTATAGTTVHSAVYTLTVS